MVSAHTGLGKHQASFSSGCLPPPGGERASLQSPLVMVHGDGAKASHPNATLSLKSLNPGSPKCSRAWSILGLALMSDRLDPNF